MMKSYRETLTRRKRRVPEQIPNDYWQAYRSLYGRNLSVKTSIARAAKIDDLNAENASEVSS